jgi:putative sugar O-methyltransferase
MDGWVSRRIVNAKKKVDRWLNFHLFLRQMEKGLRSDGNYNLDLVQEGFADRETATKEDPAILLRIVKAYNLAKEAQRAADSCYQVGNEWLPIYKSQLKEVMHALQSEDVEKLGAIYKNFWRNSSSTGLVGLSVDMQKCFLRGGIKKLHKKMFLFDTLHRYNLWKSYLGPSCDVRVLESPLVGNPYGYFLDGVFIKSGSDYLHYYANRIANLVKSETKHRKVVVELGGGFGGMAYYLARDSDLAYLDFDLPENMALTAYNLLKCFPEKRIVLYGEQALTENCIRTNDIIIMPNFEISTFPDNTADLVFNSYSLAEMSAEAIKKYIAHFERITNGYLLHVNHTRHSLLGADQFGIDPNIFHLLYKAPALWNAGRNPDMDEYEYLYRKEDHSDLN